MADVAEHDGKNILTEYFGSVTPGDFVKRVNGKASNVGRKLPLSIGGSIQIDADGSVILDTDQLPTIPPGQTLSDSVLVTLERNAQQYESTIVLDVESHSNFPPTGQNVLLVYSVVAK